MEHIPDENFQCTAEDFSNVTTSEFKVENCSRNGFT